MPLSAAFTVEGNPNPDEHVVAYLATVDLALLSLSGVNGVTWTMVACSLDTEALPTITPSGAIGQNASFSMPADSSDGVGRTFLVKCSVTGPAGTAEEYAVVGALNANGALPIVPGEENYRNATHGWAMVINDGLSRVGASALSAVLAYGNLTNGEDIILDDSSAPGVPVMTLSAVTGEGQIACVGEFDIEATDQINLSATIVSVDQGDLRILADEETIIGGGTGGAAGLLTLLNVGGGPAGFLFIDGGPGEFGGIYGNDTDGLTVYSAVAGGLTLESPVGPVVVDVGGTVATFDADLATFASGVDVAITTSGGYATTGNLRTGGDFEFVGLDSTAADMPLISWFGPGEGPNTLTLCYGSVPAGTDIYLFDQTSNGTVNIWGAALDIQSATVGIDTAGDFLVDAGDDIIINAVGSLEVYPDTSFYLEAGSSLTYMYFATGDSAYYGVDAGFSHQFLVGGVIASDLRAKDGQLAGGAGASTVLTYPVPDETSVTAKLTATLRDPTENQSGGYFQIATVRRDGGGGATIVGSVTDLHVKEDDSAWAATLAVSGNNLIVQVTPDAANATDYVVTLELQPFTP